MKRLFYLLCILLVSCAPKQQKSLTTTMDSSDTVQIADAPLEAKESVQTFQICGDSLLYNEDFQLRLSALDSLYTNQIIDSLHLFPTSPLPTAVSIELPATLEGRLYYKIYIYLLGRGVEEVRLSIDGYQFVNPAQPKTKRDNEHFLSVVPYQHEWVIVGQNLWRGITSIPKEGKRVAAHIHTKEPLPILVNAEGHILLDRGHPAYKKEGATAMLSLESGTVSDTLTGDFIQRNLDYYEYLLLTLLLTEQRLDAEVLLFFTLTENITMREIIPYIEATKKYFPRIYLNGIINK